MKRDILIDGTLINSEADFHRVVKPLLGFPDFYGENLDAFEDSVTGHMDTDVRIVWKHHLHSKRALGKVFDQIVEIFADAAKLWPSLELSLE